MMISRLLNYDFDFVFQNLCILAGQSSGDYKDLKNNSDTRVEDGTLIINNIQKSNEGRYLCEAVNGIGAGLSAVITVNVQGMFTCNRLKAECKN